MKRVLFFLLLSLTLVLPARAATITLLTPTVIPGQTIIAAFDEEPTKVTLNGKLQTAFPYQKSWRVVAPLSLATKTGPQKLTAEFDSGTFTKTISVISRKPKIIELPVPPKLNQTPQQLVQSLAKTNTGINALVQQVTSDTKFNSPFGLPLANNRTISSPFGEIRKTRSAGSGQAGEEIINHLGVDFVRPKGSLVVAINDGVVSKAYLDSTYGNSVFVDHGRGIFTLYLHLDSIRVKAGDVVKKGKVIGTLGDTGLSSAPHLHLSLKIGGVSVDPLQFVQNFK